MSQPEKFDFGTVFEGPVDDTPFGAAQEKEPVWTEEELEREKAEAHARGLAAGQAEALQGIEQRIAETVQHVMDRAQRMIENIEAVRAGLEDEAKRLAIATGTKIGSEMLAQMRRQEIEAIVSDALSLLSSQPHVVIRVHEDLLEGFKQRFEAIALQNGFTGKLIILGEPDFDKSDCRVEWAEGGISRDAGALAAQVDDIVARHMPAAEMVATAEPIPLSDMPETAGSTAPAEPDAQPATAAPDAAAPREPESPWDTEDAAGAEPPDAAIPADAAGEEEPAAADPGADTTDQTAAEPQTEETDT